MDSGASMNMAFDFQCLWMKLNFAVRLCNKEHAACDFSPEAPYYNKYLKRHCQELGQLSILYINLD